MNPSVFQPGVTVNVGLSTGQVMRFTPLAQSAVFPQGEGDHVAVAPGDPDYVVAAAGLFIRGHVLDSDGVTTVVGICFDHIVFVGSTQ